MIIVVIVVVQAPGALQLSFCNLEPMRPFSSFGSCSVAKGGEPNGSDTACSFTPPLSVTVVWLNPQPFGKLVVAPM